MGKKVNKTLLLVFIFSILFMTHNNLQAKTTKYPFPLKMPPKKIMEQDYKRIIHDLSKYDKYHFEIIINKKWKTVNVKLDFEPTDKENHEMAIFQKRDKNNNPNAEIGIYYAGKVSGDISAAQWLNNVLNNSYTDKKYIMLNKRTVNSKRDIIDDILFGYYSDNKSYISRATAFRIDNNMFFIQGNIEEKDYNQEAAHDFYVAIASFWLLKPDKL